MTPWTGELLLLFFVVCAIGVLWSVIGPRRQAVSGISWISVLASALMLLAGAIPLASGAEFARNLWAILPLGTLSLRLDMLSSIFLVTAGLVYLPASLFLGNYLQRRFRGRYPVRRYGVMHFALMASVVLILAAGDAVSFLLSWECMSILCFLLVNYEHKQQDDSRAALIMLAMSECGFLAVVIAFLILGRTASDLSFTALKAASVVLSHSAAWGVFLLGFFGFGVKAGLVPVNFWLPRSYRAAPAAFMPVLAGVTLNLGFYGILRLNADLVPIHVLGPGIVALIAGSVTALVGILYATTENDLKAMLAHSSIENAGIIVAAIGAFLVYRASGHDVAAAIALTAALYHMVNHSVYKSLLFQGAGHVEAATGTRNMNELGGLARSLPVLSAVFLAGCLSISAIPPFNGFFSEWITLQSLLRSAVFGSAPSVKIVFALCGACLALTAALAVTCFVKAFAMTFLGMQRGTWKARLQWDARAAQFPLALLALLSLLLGVLPTYVIPVLDRAVTPLAGASATTALAQPFFIATPENQQLPSGFLQDFHNLGAQTGRTILPGRGLVVLLRGGPANPVVFAVSPSYGIVVLALFLGITWVVVTRFTRRRALSRRELWAGGIPKLLPEMTYTATGFSNPVRVVFQAIFRPNIVEDARQTVAVHFRTAIVRRRDETHLVDRIVFRPVRQATSRIAGVLAGMHHGRLNAYVGYVLGFLLLVLVMYRIP